MPTLGEEKARWAAAPRSSETRAIPRSWTWSGRGSRSCMGRREISWARPGSPGWRWPRRAKAQETVKLAFCSQLLCVVPYEFTRAQGLFEAEGLSVELVYTRGGNAAMQALVGGRGRLCRDLVRRGAAGLRQRREDPPLRHHRPAAALRAGGGAVRGGGDRRPEGAGGADVGVSALGNADHTMLLYLLTEAGADPGKVEFAVLGPNLFEALRRGQIAAGMVQEPALTLIVEDGGKVLFNAMDIADSTRLLGGAYEFMGVSYRAEEREERLAQMQALARALRTGSGPSAPPRRRDPRGAAGRAPGRRRRRALRRDHRPLPRLALPRGGGDRRRGLRAGGQRARGRRRAEARHRPRRAARHRGRGGLSVEPRPQELTSEAPAAAGAPVVRVRDLRMRYGEASR